MVLDSSAVVAILWGEPEREAFQTAIADASSIAVSAVTVVEAGLVLERDGGPASATILDRFLGTIEAEIVPFDSRRITLVRYAYRKFGKGRHPAGLSFGDCFAYALAKELDCPLLFKGFDFAKTDVAVAVAAVLEESTPDESSSSPP